MTRCWVCNQPAVWRITATRLEGDADDRPDAHVEVSFAACERCIPFTYTLKAQMGPRPPK